MLDKRKADKYTRQKKERETMSIIKIEKNIRIVATKDGKVYTGRLDSVRFMKDKGLQHIVKMEDGTYRSFYPCSSVIGLAPVE
jgi:hypothetical protein